MIKIVGVLEPFKLKQNFYIYRDGNQIYAKELIYEDIPETILNLSKEYDTNDVVLIGAKQYTQGIKSTIRKKELEKYNQNDLKIELV